MANYYLQTIEEEKIIPEDKEIRQKYETALELFIDRMKLDPNILAVYCYGSMMTGEIGEHSDIDLIIVTNDDRNPSGYAVLYENDVCLHADLFNRGEFRRRQQSFRHGGFLHHMLATSKLVYAKEATSSITKGDRAIVNIAERDKELEIMRISEWLLGCFLKAQKTFYVLQDIEKSLLWFPRLAQFLAHVLLLRNDRIPGRDVLAQARELRNELLNEVITKAFKEVLSEANLEQVLNLIENFLLENREQLFRPIFSYLSEAGDARSVSEIGDHLLQAFARPSTDPPWELAVVLEWLAHHGDLMKTTTPKRLTSKSRVECDEAAYYYMGGA
ncbi:MAG: nucleotidyltransferase domain-containing protein [Candidatus Hodarchaeales archaeon]